MSSQAACTLLYICLLVLNGERWRRWCIARFVCVFCFFGFRYPATAVDRLSVIIDLAYNH
jgi:hypothetical protein